MTRVYIRRKFLILEDLAWNELMNDAMASVRVRVCVQSRGEKNTSSRRGFWWWIYSFGKVFEKTR